MGDLIVLGIVLLALHKLPDGDLKQNSDDIELIKRMHVARHADDAIEIYQRRKTDG
jgi:hypothetical protein